MWELDCEESWAPKNWCFLTVVLKTLESPLDFKEIQPVPPKGNQSWIFTGRTDVDAETPIFWPSHVKSWLIGKDPDAGRDWGQEEKETTEDEMVGWHHWLDGHEFEWTPGVGDRQGGMGLQRVGQDWATELNWYCFISFMAHQNWTRLSLNTLAVLLMGYAEGGTNHCRFLWQISLFFPIHQAFWSWEYLEDLLHFPLFIWISDLVGTWPCTFSF